MRMVGLICLPAGRLPSVSSSTAGAASSVAFGLRHFNSMTAKLHNLDHYGWFYYICKKGQTMKAIEINSKTDKTGHLKINYKLNKSDSKVRVLILLDDDFSEKEEETIWLSSISNNPAFDFLKDSAEDIYSLKDGEPFND